MPGCNRWHWALARNKDDRRLDVRLSGRLLETGYRHRRVRRLLTRYLWGHREARLEIRPRRLSRAGHRLREPRFLNGRRLALGGRRIGGQLLLDGRRGCLL